MLDEATQQRVGRRAGLVAVQDALRLDRAEEHTILAHVALEAAAQLELLTGVPLPLSKTTTEEQK